MSHPETVPFPPAGVRVRERPLFSVEGPFLSKNQPLGQFLEVFDQIAAQAPRYLPAADWERHRQFARLFAGHRVRRWREHKDAPVAELPIEALSSALCFWIGSVAGADTAHPLAATFALQAGETLRAHARGIETYGEEQGPPFRLDAVVSDFPEEHDRFPASRLKREITEQFGGRLELLANIPDGTATELRLGGRGGSLDTSAGVMRFIAARCHLSENWHEHPAFDFLPPASETPNLAAGAALQGAAVVSLAESPAEGDYWWTAPLFLSEEPHPTDRPVACHVPIRWITHCRVWRDRDPIWFPVPEDWPSLDLEHGVQRRPDWPVASMT